MTITMDIIVPRPRHCPMPQIAPSEDIRPIRIPARASMEPDVTIVGKAKFIVSIMASFFDIFSFNSIKRPEITIA